MGSDQCDIASAPLTAVVTGSPPPGPTPPPPPPGPTPPPPPPPGGEFTFVNCGDMTCSSYCYSSVLPQNRCVSTFYECAPPRQQVSIFCVEQFLLEFESLFCVRYKGSTSSVCNAGTLQVTYWPNSRSCAGAGQNDTIAAGVCMLSSDAISYVRIAC